MRRLVTFLAVALSTAVAGLWWLHDGDLEDAVGPLLDEVAHLPPVASEEP